MYSYRDVLTFVEEEDVKFIRLAFCDVKGKPKNISIMPSELERAFSSGISFNASAICGFDTDCKSDLFLHPDPSTLCVLPWRPQHGRVVRMFCDITYPDGTPFERDGRYILKNAIEAASKRGLQFYFGAEFEFYLFKTDEMGEPTKIPFDRAGYMDIAPDDKGETVRREICLTLLDMDIIPESSHHEKGPSQHEIDFKYSDALRAAEDAVTFKSVVKTVAMRNGLYASFSPKPLENESGNGLHINISVSSQDGRDYCDNIIAGIMSRIKEITLFLNPCANSYSRLGEMTAPRYITWSGKNQSQLIKIPAMRDGLKRMEIRSSDPTANPYIVYALLIRAALLGIENDLKLPEPVDIDLYSADEKTREKYERLPDSLEDALEEAKNSDFVKSVLPEGYII